MSKRTYRMAFVTDPTYATYFGTANVFAEKATLMDRVNQVYNDDLAIEFVLITGTDTKLNLDTVAKMTSPNGPCGQNACFTADPGATTAAATPSTRNVFVLGQIIGADNFDIGHIGLGINGGGIAGLGVVGDSGKARGCTGLPTPEGDFYAIDYVAHEVGHQMGGNHTFNGTQRNCARQPQRRHLGRAGFRLLGDGVRRHLRQPTTCSRTPTRTSPSAASTRSRPRPRRRRRASTSASPSPSPGWTPPSRSRSPARPARRRP